MPTKNLQFYQNRIVSLVSFIAAVIAICGWIVTVKLYADRIDSMAVRIDKVEDHEKEQLMINGKMLTLYDLLTKEQ
jgi:hypothetical protein